MPDAAQHGARPVGVVTGAGAGVGRAIALRLASLGWRLVLAARTQAALRETAELAGEQAPQDAEDIALVVPTDIGDARRARALIETTIEAFGRIDALINNAGVADFVPIEHTTDAVIDTMFRVNAIGPVAAICAAWPHMLRQKSGRIVNVSTMSTVDPFPGLFAYAASKAALNTAAIACRNEGHERGIHAFSVAPGAVETAMLRAFIGRDQLPSSATLSPDEVARIVVACAIGERDADSGKTIFIPSPGATAPSADALFAHEENPR